MLGFHALNARDNALLRWMFLEFSNADPAVFRDAMQVEARRIRDLLASRDVRYEQLKSALVPTADGVQAVFFYDWRDEPSWNYAVAFARRYLPALRDDLRTSVLQGDLITWNRPVPVSALEAAVVRPREQPVNWQTQYAVYFNNLRPGDVARIHESLTSEPRYSGYIDMSFTSPVRDFIADTVVPHWVLSGRKVILSHGGDDPAVGDDDPVGFGLPDHGYEVVSLLDSYFTGFLSYKIEATNPFQAVDDRIINLAAVTGELVDVESVAVVVPDDKLEKYLLRDHHKLRLMVNVGLQDMSAGELAEVVKTKLLQSYVYDFRFAPDGTPLFAVAAEFEKPDGRLTRRLLALKHDRSAGVISLVTMY